MNTHPFEKIPKVNYVAALAGHNLVIERVPATCRFHLYINGRGVDIEDTPQELAATVGAGRIVPFDPLTPEQRLLGRKLNSLGSWRPLMDYDVVERQIPL